MDIDTIRDMVKATSSGLIAAAITYYFSQRKYTFEKLYDRKTTYIEEIFEKIVLLEKYLKKYVMTIGSINSKDTLEDRKKALKSIQEKFFELQEYFWKKEIVFDQKTNNSVESFIDLSIQILSNLEVSNISSQFSDGKTSDDLWKKAYETMTEKLTTAKQALKEDFRNTLR